VRLTDLLALSHVPRWGIVDHLKPQTVSDHVYRTMVIATDLASRLKLPFGLEGVMLVLQHDAEECRTGDVPTPAKHLLIDHPHCDWLEPTFASADEARIAHLADLIEAYTFISRYGVGDHATRVSSALWNIIDGQRPKTWEYATETIIRDIQVDGGR